MNCLRYFISSVIKVHTRKNNRINIVWYEFTDMIRRPLTQSSKTNPEKNVINIICLIAYSDKLLARYVISILFKFQIRTSLRHRIIWYLMYERFRIPNRYLCTYVNYYRARGLFSHRSTAGLSFTNGTD